MIEIHVAVHAIDVLVWIAGSWSSATHQTGFRVELYV